MQWRRNGSILEKLHKSGLARQPKIELFYPKLSCQNQSEHDYTGFNPTLTRPLGTKRAQIETDSTTEKQVSPFTLPHRAEGWRGITSPLRRPHVAPVAGFTAPVVQVSRGCLLAATGADATQQKAVSTVSPSPGERNGIYADLDRIKTRNKKQGTKHHMEAKDK